MNDEDARWLDAAAALAARGIPLSRPNPAVGAVVVEAGKVVGRGWTMPGGRPHAEAIALDQAGGEAKGATLYVTLEPCAHQSTRGPACADLVAASGVARVVVGCADPDPRTAGAGIARLRAAGVQVDLIASPASQASLSGYLCRARLGRPEITLKLAMSIDGRIALASGESQWITGEAARAHCHVMRSRSDAIVVGGGTLRADEPRLDVRLPGLEIRRPRRFVLSRSPAPEGWPDGWGLLTSPQDVFGMTDIQYLFVEGGAQAAASFLAADLVDRLLVYRAPIVIGDGLAAVGDIGLQSLPDAHGRWQLAARRTLGSDALEVYEARRCLPES